MAFKQTIKGVSGSASTNVITSLSDGPNPAIKKMNSDLFIMTYGSFVTQLMKDFENDEEVNKQLDKIGYNIGIRLIDDLIARSLSTSTPIINKCHDMKETADVLSKIGFKTYLNIVPTITNFIVGANGYQEFSLVFEYNPLADYVEIPDGKHDKLSYSNVICGIIRGALEMMQLETSVYFVQDTLRGNSTNEIKVKLLRKIEDSMPASED
ncbi:unnamed protein product [Gordionus sp. m RMFG-2023]|uniref:trafficking protein particle complex subunit 3-like n=1 Tax=Gordionus sp. m RMFG-2023 TaxID=3053472 RepID=UPI0030E46237